MYLRCLPNIRATNDDVDILVKKLPLSLHDKKQLHVLDTGCGNGERTLEVISKRNLHCEKIYGIEIVPSLRKEAEARGLQMIADDMQQTIPLADDSIDIILSMQVIEHLYFTDRYLQEMHRLLKKDTGIFVLNTTNLAAWHYRVQLLLGFQPVCLHPSTLGAELTKGLCHPLYGHHSVFTHNYLKQVLKQHNFKILQSYTHSVFPFPHRYTAWITCLCNIGTFSCFMLSK